MAKSFAGRESLQKERLRKNKVSRTIGLALTGIQICASLFFLVSLLVLGMIPAKYLAIAAGFLGILALITFIGQYLSKKRAISGKIFSIVISLLLFLGSFFILKTNGAVVEISGGNKKIDKIVVAVLLNDPAETIQDAADYNFGIQYALKGDEIRAAVDKISDEVGQDIWTTECVSIQEQAELLHAGVVNAIIYNEAYAGVIQDEFGDFNNNLKIIYSYEIESEMNNKSSDIKVEDNSFTVYISGIDVYGAIETNSRSDVNILAEVNPTTHQILLVTTPRDYYVELPGISGGMKDKLTHAGIYGVDVSMAALDNLYDAETEFYARVNFTSLVQMVDALGGIDVYSEYEFTTSEESGVVMHVSQGYNHFNGEQALAFCRERMNVEGGDNTRGKNQQAVITAMIQKAISPAILLGANELLNSVSGNVDTNMTQKQIQELIKSQLADPQPWKIKSMAAEGIADSQPCFSSGSQELYVTQPGQESVDAIKDTLSAVENGEVFEDSAIAQ
ncbi:MAG: LCP family protein [Schaedlerella sp.]|nr:LCP family protein [Schaedlerella sp.]